MESIVRDKYHKIPHRAAKKLNEHIIVGLLVQRKCQDVISGGQMPVTCERISEFFWEPGPPEKNKLKVPSIRRIINDLEKRGVLVVVGKTGKEKLYDLAIDGGDFIEELGNGIRVLRFKAPKPLMVKSFCTWMLYFNKGVSWAFVKIEGVDDEVSNFVCLLVSFLCGLNGYKLCEKCEFVKREILREDNKEFEQDLQTKMKLLSPDLRGLLNKLVEHELFGGLSLRELKLNRNGIRDKLEELIRKNEDSIRTLIEYEKKRQIMRKR